MIVWAANSINGRYIIVLASVIFLSECILVCFSTTFCKDVENEKKQKIGAADEFNEI